MPAWSTEVADEFIRLALREGRALDQAQLQKLVYIAHGWRLATTGEPLTGDRPEAWEIGPVYRRLADALAHCGLVPVTRCISDFEGVALQSDLDANERAIIGRVYTHYAGFEASQLSNLTRRNAAPWSDVFAGGAGKNRDIAHHLIRDQFVQLAENLTP